MSEPHKKPPRGPGRPRTEVPLSSSATTWLRPKEYDQAVRIAAARDQSLSGLLRQAVRVLIIKEKP